MGLQLDNSIEGWLQPIEGGDEYGAGSDIRIDKKKQERYYDLKDYRRQLHNNKEIRFLGIVSSPSFVRSPEGNGVIERFFRTLKEQLLWIKRFRTVDELVDALHEFKHRYNDHWIMQRHGYRTPKQVRDEWNAAMIKIA